MVYGRLGASFNLALNHESLFLLKQVRVLFYGLLIPSFPSGFCEDFPGEKVFLWSF